MISQIGDIALDHAANEMRLGRHPAHEWEIEKWYWTIRAVEQYMAPSHEKRKEVWAEFGALKKDGPAKPYQRREIEVAAGH